MYIGFHKFQRESNTIDDYIQIGLKHDRRMHKRVLSNTNLWQWNLYEQLNEDRMAFQFAHVQNL